MLNIWKLLPGSQTSSFNRPKTKANDFISIDTICYVRSSTSGGNKSRFDLELKGGEIRSFMADSPTDCLE